MTVGELKSALANIPDHIEVYMIDDTQREEVLPVVETSIDMSYPDDPNTCYFLLIHK